MKSFVTTAIFLATFTGGSMALPTGHVLVYRRGADISPFWFPLSLTSATTGNPGVISVGGQSSPSSASAYSPYSPNAGYYNYLGGYGENAGQPAPVTAPTSDSKPAQNVNTNTPSAGVNVGGQGAKPGQISTNAGQLAAANAPIVTPSTGNQGNGGTISINNGATAGDAGGTTAPTPAGKPAQNINARPPTGGINVGGQGGNGGNIFASLGQLFGDTSQPAVDNTSVNVPPGGSLTVMGENGGVGYGGNQGNGGTVTIKNGSATGDKVTLVDDSAVASPAPVA